MDRLIKEIIFAAGIMEEEQEQVLLAALRELSPRQYYKAYSQSKLSKADVWYKSVNEPLPALLLRMISIVNVSKGMRVLELFPVSGFSTALLSSLKAYVFSVYREYSQVQMVRQQLDLQGFQNSLIRTGDSERVWNEQAPFDCIFHFNPVAEIPLEILELLSTDGGSLIALLEEEFECRLCLWQFVEGELKTMKFEPVFLKN